MHWLGFGKCKKKGVQHFFPCFLNSSAQLPDGHVLRAIPTYGVMTDRLKDRFYGLVIGGAIGSMLGTAQAFRPDAVIKRPSDLVSIGIKPGFWMEGTANFLCLLVSLLDDAGCQTDKQLVRYRDMIRTGRYTSTGFCGEVDKDTWTAATGAAASQHTHNTGSLVRSGAAAMYYFDQYEDILLTAWKQSLTTHQCLLCADACKLWASILDSTLHGRTKKEILNLDYYGNLELSTEIWAIYDIIENVDTQSEPLSEAPVAVLSAVLYVFKKSNNFGEGLAMILKQYKGADYACLYGQLAGAYYGLTDIDESWLDDLVQSEYLSDLTDRCLARIS